MKPARIPPSVVLAGFLVFAFTPSGVLRAQSAQFQRAQVTVADSATNGLYGTFGVAVDNQGNLYVSDWSGRLLKETPSGVGFGGYTQTVILNGLSDPNHVAADSQGNVYLADSSGRVLKETPSGGTYTQTVIATAAVNGITQPSGVAVDQSGNVYVSDFLGAEVYKETLSGGIYTQSAVTTTANGLFEPSGVAVDSLGNVFIADIGNNRVVEEKPSGSAYVQSVLASGLNHPFGVSVDSNGNLYIADSENNRILKETLSNGSYVQSVLVTGLTHPDATAVDLNGNLFIADTAASLLLEEKSSQVDFGPVAVGATSSTSIALTFQFSAAVTLNSNTPYQVLTMGATGQDFADAGSATCTASAFSSGSTCTVNVTFSPKLAGTRSGAVALIDSSGNQLAVAYISGTGQAPQIGYSPGMQNVVANSAQNGLVFPWSVAADGNGDLYISDYGNNRVLKETLSGGSYSQSLVTNNLVGGLSYPRQIALDGSGNVYIADAGTNRVLKEAVSGSSYVQSVVANKGTNGLTEPFGVAVDGSGNVYIVDGGNNRVLKETLAGGSYTQSIVTSGLDNPLAVAVDGNANLYITDMLNRRVLKETYSNGSYTQSVLANNENDGLADPYSVAVDGTGNVYISDSSNTVFKETPAGNGSYIQSVVAISATDGLSAPQGIAVDGLGNVYIADFNKNRVLQIALGTPPVLSFGTEGYGSTSAVQSVQALNNGNETLQAVAPGMSVPPGFVQVAGSETPPDCTSTFSLPQGAACNISLDFSPWSGEFGSLIGNVLLTDNNLNATSSTQAIELTGTGVKGTPVVKWATPPAILQGTALSAIQLNATANVPGILVYTPAAGTVLAQGQQTLSVSFTPTDANDYNMATATVSLVVYPPEQIAGAARWVWMGGSNTLMAEANQTYGVPGVYATLGVASPASIPGGRVWSSQWTDSQGNFWLFGGWGYDSVGTLGELNDLWEFNPATQAWIWVGGSSTMAINNTTGKSGQWGVYGTRNSPATTNIPGGRSSASTWVDSSGNFWLFGGEGIDSAGNFSDLNDVWEYSPSTNEWTWKGGKSVACNVIGDVGTFCGLNGVYGTPGTPAPGNAPGSRFGANSWTDSNGNLWLFGGNGLDSAGTSGDMNDLWTYNPSTNLWAWMGGSNIGAQPGNYGNPGQPSTDYVPGARDSATAWTDKSGNFWVFGGRGVDVDGTSGSMNDLWEYVPSTGQWTWLSGSMTVPAQNGGQPGVYGTLNSLAATNTPGGRWGSTGLLDKSGDLALFGGIGFDSAGTQGGLNDVWLFKPSLGQWKWVGGYNTVDCQNCGWPGVYGTLGTLASGNSPGGRGGAGGWVDSGGNDWVFGGSGVDSVGVIGSLNDLWVVGTPAAQPTFNPLPGAYTQSEYVSINDTTPNADIFYTTDGSAPTINSTKFTSQIPVSQTETINAIAMAPGYITSPVATGAYTINAPQLVITWPTPAAITYGTPLSATQLDATANVAGSFVYSPAAGTILAAGGHTLNATFTPTDTVDYSVTTAKVALTVNQAAPTITWPKPAPITYGTALSAMQLDATASLPGTFVYSPPAGTVLKAGSQILSVVFTPADTTDYISAKATVTLTVNQATPTITWPKPAPITYRTALSATQLDATASAPGSFIYFPAAGTVLKPGTQILSVVFTPTDTTDSTIAKATVTLTVNQATPTITWPKPAPITYRTALSATQLDATASVPGAFIYFPPAGTVLSVGSHTLTATFTPTDTADYTVAKASVTLTVNPAPTVTIAPAKLTFANQKVGTTSAAQDVVLTNTGTISPLAINGITASAGFSISSTTCGTSLTAGASCKVSVGFAPKASGLITGTLNFVDNALNSPQTVALSGNGLFDRLMLAPAQVAFSGQLVSSTSAPQTFTLMNTGDTTVTGIALATAGPFAVSATNCAGSLLPTRQCTISVVFSPSVNGTARGKLTVTDSALNSPQAASLSGMGAASAVPLTPGVASFPAQAVGTTSPSQRFTLTNRQGVTLSGIGFSTTGDFAVSATTCPASILANRQCTIDVVFAPTATGLRTGQLFVRDSAKTSPQLADLTGTGTPGSGVHLTPAHVTFPDQLVSTTSAPQVFTLINSGGTAARNIAISTTGPFAVSATTCGGSLPANQQCTIQVVFTPPKAGNASGSLGVRSASATQSANLSGVGSNYPVTLTPTVVSFPAQPVGITSAPQRFTLNNLQSTLLGGIAFSTTGDFTVSATTCGVTLAAQKSCTLDVVFAPTSTGFREGQLFVADSAKDSPQSADLTGNGTPGAGVHLVPAQVAFPDQLVSTTSAPQVFTLINSGDTAARSIAISTTGPFAVSATTCGGSLPANQQCTIGMVFTPPKAGTASGTLVVRTAGGTQSARLSGVGSEYPVTLTPTVVSFPAQAVGITSHAQVITLSNLQSTTLGAISFRVTGDFAVSSTTCGSSLAAQKSCTISVVFAPTSTGFRAGQLFVSDSAKDSPQSADLTGTGTPGSGVHLTPAQVAFPDQLVSTTSAPQVFTLINSGDTAATNIAISTTGPFAVSATTCGGSLPANHQCTISAVFTPPKAGNASGTLEVRTAGGTQSARLGGVGRDYPVTLTPSVINFPAQPVGISSHAHVIMLSNLQSTTLGAIGFRTTGDFAVSATTCGVTLAAQRSCTISVVFAPTSTGFRAGQLFVSDSAKDSPQSADLNGTGTPGSGVHLTPAQVAFPDQLVSTTSAPQVFTLINSGVTAAANIAISTTGPFAVSATQCGASLLGKQQCTISVVFTPSNSGPQSGQLNVSTSNNRLTANLSGTPLRSQVTLTPSVVRFPAQAVGTTSPSQRFTLINLQAASLTGIEFWTTGDFAVSATNCGVTLAAQKSCTLEVVFAPAATGLRTGQLFVKDSASDSPQSADLTGIGSPGTDGV